MVTRSTRKTPAKTAKATQSPDEPAVTGKVLAPSSTNPPLVFILPEKRSPDARIVSLPNPATSAPNRYYACPDQGVYEFTKIAAPKKNPSSWLIAPRDPIQTRSKSSSDIESQPDQEKQGADVSGGYTIEQPDLFVATPIDPLFLLLPALVPPHDNTHKQLFLSIDDHLDALSETSKHLKHVLRAEKLRSSLEQRAASVCDVVEAGDEKMFRLSEARLVKELVTKAETVVKNGLPSSLELKFVREPLQAPESVTKNESLLDTNDVAEEEGGVPLMTPAESQESLAEEEGGVPLLPTAESQDSLQVQSTAGDSQASQASAITVFTEATSFSGDEAIVPNLNSATAEVTHLLRIRTAFDFVVSSYIPVAMRDRLSAVLSSPDSPVDFSSLDSHLQRIASLRKEVQALRSLSDNISRKRSHVDDDEAEAARAEKKRKKDEEEAKKKNQSRGVKQLSKVDTSGMKKLSSFFTKAPAKKTKA